jgi:hypothetical protein
MKPAWLDNLTEQIQKADNSYREECERFERMVGKTFNLIIVEILNAIREGKFEALQDGVYRASVVIEPNIMEALKEHVKEHRDEILYFKNKYKESCGISRDIVKTLIAKEVHAEYPSIQLKLIDTQFFSRIYDGYYSLDGISCLHKVGATVLIVLTTIAMCGLPIVASCFHKTSNTIFQVYFTKKE